MEGCQHCPHTHCGAWPPTHPGPLCECMSLSLTFRVTWWMWWEWGDAGRATIASVPGLLPLVSWPGSVPSTGGTDVVFRGLQVAKRVRSSHDLSHTRAGSLRQCFQDLPEPPTDQPHMQFPSEPGTGCPFGSRLRRQSWWSVFGLGVPGSPCPGVPCARLVLTSLCLVLLTSVQSSLAAAATLFSTRA